LELARKSERKWLRTRKFKGLYESIQILQKSEITKRFATFFILSPIFLAKSKYSSQNLWSFNNYLYLCRVKCLKITIMATQVLQFNQAQQAVLNVISCLQSEQDLADLKRTLVKFMNDRLQREIDKLWESGEMSNEKLQEMQSEHLRTTYK